MNVSFCFSLSGVVVVACEKRENEHHHRVKTRGAARARWRAAAMPETETEANACVLMTARQQPPEPYVRTTTLENNSRYFQRDSFNTYEKSKKLKKKRRFFRTEMEHYCWQKDVK